MTLVSRGCHPASGSSCNPGDVLQRVPDRRAGPDGSCGADPPLAAGMVGRHEDVGPRRGRGGSRRTDPAAARAPWEICRAGRTPQALRAGEKVSHVLPELTADALRAGSAGGARLSCCAVCTRSGTAGTGLASLRLDADTRRAAKQDSAFLFHSRTWHPEPRLSVPGRDPACTPCSKSSMASPPIEALQASHEITPFDFLVPARAASG